MRRTIDWFNELESDGLGQAIILIVSLADPMDWKEGSLVRKLINKFHRLNFPHNYENDDESN